MVLRSGLAPASGDYRSPALLSELQEGNWHGARESHPAGRFWRPTRPLEHLRRMVPEAGSAPAPAVWKTAMHLSTPLGHENWWTGRESRPPQNPCQGFSPLSEHAGPNWWRRRNLHPPSRAANATRPCGTCAPIWKLVETGGFRTRDLVIAGHPLFLSELRPRGKWTRRRDLHPRASALQAGPLAARARRVKPQLRSLGAGRFLRTSALIDCG